MRLETGFRKKTSATQHDRTTPSLHLTTLMNDFQCGLKNVATFIRGVAHAFSRTDPSDEIMDADHRDMDADNLKMKGQVEKSDLEDELQEGLGEYQDEGQASIESATVASIEGTVSRISNDSVPQISRIYCIFKTLCLII